MLPAFDCVTVHLTWFLSHDLVISIYGVKGSTFRSVKMTVRALVYRGDFLKSAPVELFYFLFHQCIKYNVCFLSSTVGSFVLPSFLPCCHHEVCRGMLAWQGTYIIQKLTLWHSNAPAEPDSSDKGVFTLIWHFTKSSAKGHSVTAWKGR